MCAALARYMTKIDRNDPAQANPSTVYAQPVHMNYPTSAGADSARQAAQAAQAAQAQQARNSAHRVPPTRRGKSGVQWNSQLTSHDPNSGYTPMPAPAPVPQPMWETKYNTPQYGQVMTQAPYPQQPQPQQYPQQTQPYPQQPATVYVQPFQAQQYPQQPVQQFTTAPMYAQVVVPTPVPSVDLRVWIEDTEFSLDTMFPELNRLVALIDTIKVSPAPNEHDLNRVEKMLTTVQRHISDLIESTRNTKKEVASALSGSSGTGGETTVTTTKTTPTKHGAAKTTKVVTKTTTKNSGSSSSDDESTVEPDFSAIKSEQVKKLVKFLKPQACASPKVDSYMKKLLSNSSFFTGTTEITSAVRSMAESSLDTIFYQPPVEICKKNDIDLKQLGMLATVWGDNKLTATDRYALAYYMIAFKKRLDLLSEKTSK